MSEERKGLTGSLFKGLTGKAVESLAKSVGINPTDRGWVTVDIGASLMSVSPKVALEFFRAVKEVSVYLESNDLRAWAELGKRIALNSSEEASEFFRYSAETLGQLPEALRVQLVALCAKQIVLSPQAAISTFRNAPGLAYSLGAENFATRLFAIAVEVAQRSVKHSTEVLTAAPAALAALRTLEDIEPDLSPTEATLTLAENFAQRTGATAAEFLSAIGEGLSFVTRPADIIALCEQTAVFLERGGATALQYFRSARSVIEVGGADSFEKWNRVTRQVAAEGNAIVYDFLKLTPKVVTTLSATQRKRISERIGTVLDIVEELAKNNVYVALECFKSSPRALASASIDQFQSWARDGADLYKQDRRRAQAYYALESKSSQESLRGAHEGVALESVSHLLRLYVEGLTGREMMIAPLGSVPEESRINDGQTIQLPAAIAEFGSPDEDFKLYKALAAHAAGQVEFGTREIGTTDLRAALRQIDNFFEDAIKKEIERAELEDLRRNEEFVQYSNTEHLEHLGRLVNRPALRDDQFENADYKTVLSRFPNTLLATRIFTTLENGRIDWRLRGTYRGIRRDLDFVQQRLTERRPPIAELTVEQTLYELLFQITLCGGVIDETARRAYSQIILELEVVVAEYLRKDDASVADTLLATKRVYELLGQARNQQEAEKNDEAEEEKEDDQEDNNEGNKQEQQQTSAQQQRTPDVFNQWTQSVEEVMPSDSDLLNELMNAETSEQDLQEGDEVFFYDEWDRELGDHRAKWCRVIQRENRKGQRDFVENVRARYAGVISSIRHQFQMLKPESLRKIKGELDGEDYDLQALIDHYVDRKTTGRASDRLYIRRIRRERDVAVSFLLDMSSSTARTITRHPNQPYTRPGQKIIDIEKQGLVLMSEALEAVGDAYSISGFTSEGRRNVKYFLIKRFGEKYTDLVERRIGGITYHNNTRLGAAIRHAAAELERQDARTKLLIILSDGRPYDHDYGDSRYAREDTKIALRHTKTSGITPFCITIDRESEAELKDLYGEVGYTIIDDVMSLPERLPGIYRRLTT